MLATSASILLFALQESKKKEAAKRKRERESAKKAKPAAKKAPKGKVSLANFIYIPERTRFP
jgi:hypothetical protein